MKALLYKEFRLAMHPICYIFIALFPFMVLIPNYPLAVGFIYILPCYPILFLGANKGQQSNDLLFSTLLPVRKKDIVLARLITVILMQAAFILITSALLPLVNLIHQSIAQTGGSMTNPGLSADGYVSVVGIALIGFAIADIIFFSIYYKHGHSIVMSTLLMILGFVFYLLIFTLALPMIPGLEGYKTFLCDSGLGYQFIILGVALLLYAVLHYLAYRIASKELENVDF